MKAKLLTAAAILLAPVFFSRAEDSHAKRGEAKAVSACSLESQGAACAMEKLKEWDEKLHSLKSRFVQTVYFKEAGIRKTMEGRLWYKKPDMLRIDHTGKPAQRMITDKKNLWIYKPDDKQVVKASWEKWKKMKNYDFSGLLDFGDYSKILEKNEAAFSSSPAAITLTLTPKSGSKSYTLALTLSPTDYFPRGAALSLKDTEINIRFENPEKNAEIPGEIFEFKPPRGCEVIKFD